MGGKPRSNSVTDAQIIETYNRIGAGRKTARALGIGETTVYRALMKHGVQRGGLDRYRANIKFKGQERQIREWYDSGMTYDAIREHLGPCSDHAIKTAIKRAGGTLRVNPAPTETPDEVEQVRQMHADGLGQVEISLRIGRSQSFVSRVMRRHEIEPHSNSGAQHSRWKGGRWVDGNGYVKVAVEVGDPVADGMRHRDGYVLEHRWVLAKSLGRPLTAKETVHHKNGDRTDNRLDNLQLRRGKHGKGVVLCCADCGSTNIKEQAIE